MKYMMILTMSYKMIVSQGCHAMIFYSSLRTLSLNSGGPHKHVRLRAFKDGDIAPILPPLVQHEVCNERQQTSVPGHRRVDEAGGVTLGGGTDVVLQI